MLQDLKATVKPADDSLTWSEVEKFLEENL